MNRAIFKKLPIGWKLFISSSAFVLPVAVLVFFMNLSFEYDINIGKAEIAGSNYLEDVYTLYSTVHLHYTFQQAAIEDFFSESDRKADIKQLIHRVESGHVQLQARLLRSEKQRFDQRHFIQLIQQTKAL